MLSFLCTDDTGLGRVNYTTMSEQSLMELLVADLTGAEKFHGPDGNFLPLEEWSGITFSKDGNVRDISWSNNVFLGNNRVLPGGTIHLRWLPRTLRKFTISSMGLHGTVDGQALPDTLAIFSLHDNKIGGTVETRNLPAKLMSIFFSKNAFSGTLDLENLPPNLRALHANSNRFEGSVCLEKLPETLQKLHLDDNCFSGTVYMGNLPSELHHLSLGGNNIQQEVLIFEQTEEIEVVLLDEDSFMRIVDKAGRPAVLPQMQEFAAM